MSTAALLPVETPTDAPRDRSQLLLDALAVAAVITAVAAVRQIDLADVGDTGLAAAMPVSYWVALGVLNVGFVVAVTRRRLCRRTLVIHLAALVVVVFGVASVLSPYPRAEPTWRHLGIIDHLARGEPLEPDIDAYFNWPGFFALATTLRRMAGAASFDLVIRWAPVWINALWLVAMRVPVRVLARGDRRAWAALWIFCLFNWIDQDYFSPQAFAYFLDLVIVGLVLWGLAAVWPDRTIGERGPVLTRLRRLLASRRQRVPGPGATPDQRAALIVIALVVAAAVVVSHQLTPVMLLVSISLLTLLGRVWTRRLPWLIAVVLLVWLATGARAYLAGHPVLSLAELKESTGANVAHRIGGSAGHLFVVHVRMALFAVVVLAAAAGWACRWWAHRRGEHSDLVTPAALAVAPFVLVPANSYGGEMLLRATLFALPFAAVLAADAVPLPTGGRPASRARSLVAIAVMAALATGAAGLSVLARYGNARFDMFSAAEVAAVDELYRIAPDDGVLISAAHPTPWRDRGYDDYRYSTVQDLCREIADPRECGRAVLTRIGNGGGRGVVVILRSGTESIRMQGFMTMDDLRTVETVIASAPGATRIDVNADARFYVIGGPT